MFLAKNTAKNNRKMDERWWWKERSNAASPSEHTEAIGHVKCLLDPCIHSAIVIIFSCLFPSELHVKAQKITSDVHILKLHPMTFLTETYGFGLLCNTIFTLSAFHFSSLIPFCALQFHLSKLDNAQKLPFTLIFGVQYLFSSYH